MSFSKKTHKLVGENENIVKKSHKHDANLQKNSTLYFQVGLILCLLTTYGLFEMNFESKSYNYIFTQPEDPEAVYVINIVPEVMVSEPIKDVKVTQQKKVILKKLKIIDDKTTFNSNITNPTIAINIPITAIIKKKNDVIVPVKPRNIMNVDHAPIYPGCESLLSNFECRQCMSQKIGKLVERKFNTDLGENLGLPIVFQVRD